MANKIFFKTGLASSLPTTKTAGQLLFAIDGTTGSIYLDKDSNTRIKFNADAVKLATPRSINGTLFDGSSDITTANWGTARNISISDATGANTGTAVSVNGSKAVILKLPATIVATLKGNADTATKAATADTATTATTTTGNAATATILQTARSINGTSFNGSADITTSKWGTSRNISIGNSDGTGAGTAVAVDGSGNVTLKLPSTITANLSGNATTATTATTTTGNAGTATKLKTARKINGTSFDGSADITTTNWGTARTVSISSAAGTSGTSVNGSSNVALIVPKTMTGFSSITSTKFIGALGESYLTWGGKNFAGSYGPLDAAMIPDLGANRLAFASAAGIKVEYSTNGGSTWVDYGATDAEKKKIFAQGGALVCGKNSDKTADLSKMMLRITLDTDKVPIYTVLNKFAIYVNTEGASGCYCTIDASLESTPTTFVTFADKVSITGWSGWNIINTNSLTTFGNTASAHYGIVRFTFGCTGRSTSNYPGLRIQRIMGFGGVGWTTPSNMARYGTIYTYDENQNVNFPAQVTATKFNGVASKATVLETARSINGTSFNGSANIVTTQWGTARNITIKDGSGNKGTSVSVDGSANVELILPATIAATVSAANKLTVNAGDSNTPVYFEGGVPKAVTSIDVKSDRAAKLDPGAKINGTTFTGETDITTSKWGTTRSFTVGNTTKSVNGSAAMSWTLAEIGAVDKAGDTMTGHLTGKVTNASWIGTTRKGAFRTETAASGGSAVAALSMKTSSGAWSISNVTGSNNLYFVFGTDENYEAGTNTTANYYITSSGAFSGSAATLTTARSINGTSFNGSSDITTSKWGTTRILSISSTAGTTGTSVDGSADKSLIIPSTMTGFSSITSTKLIATTVASDTGHIVFPDGGQYTTTDISRTGYLKITLPVSWTSAMMRFYVDIYNYSSGTSATYMIGGYNYSSNSAWKNVYAQAIGTPGSKLGNLSVHFGHDGSKCAIYIGAADTSWNYPQVMIRDLYIGYSQDEKNYTTGWAIDFTTTLGTISQTVENTNIAYKLYTARTINGTSFDGSGNITTTNWGTSRNITIKDGSGNKGTAVAVNGGSNVELILPTTIAATVSAANKLTVNAGDSNTPVYFEGGVPKAVTSIDVKSDKAAKLDPGAKINGTTFTGASDITTSNWGTSRTLTIGNTGKSVNGSGNVSWTIAEIGALALTGGTITGKTYINTSSGTNPFYITRTGGTSESTAFWQDDHQLHLDVTNDETTTGISFKLSATDTENSDGSKASSGTITFAMASGATTITADKFSGAATKLATARNITISGTASSSVGTFDGSANTTIYMPLTIQGFNEIKTKKLTITNTSAGAHIAFSRGSWNYFTAPASGSFAFSPNGRETSATGAVAVIESTGIIPGNSNNTFNLGSSSYKWKNVYATTFTGALSGNASTATAIQTAGTTAQFYRGDNTWSNTIKQTANAQLGVDTDLKIGTARKDLNFDITNGSGSGINDGYAGGITWGNGNAAYAGIYYQTSGNYGSRLLFGTTGSYANGSYARMIITSSGYVGIGTLSPSQKLAVEGNIYASSKVSSPVIEGTTRGQFGGTSTTSYALNTSSFICDSWIRSKGDTGWYNETHGGGWYMTDTTYIRSYGSKKVYVSNDSMNAIYATGAVRALKGFTVDETMTISPSHNNELNFGGSNNSSTIYFGYRALDSKPIPTKFVFGSNTGTADLQAKTVYLGSGTSSYISSSQYTGNAATATAFSTNRTITLTGDVTGSASTNGSSGWSISTTVADNSHNHSYLSGWSDTRDVITTPNDYNGVLKVVGIKTATGSGTLDGSSYSTLIGIRGWSDITGGNSHELAFTGGGGLYRRYGATTTWNSWLNILDSGNYTSYTVTKTGSGASGTWSIDITGSADKIISDKKHAVSSAYASGKGNRIYLRQYVNTSSSSTSSTDCNYFETYNLPTPTPQNSGNRNYNILTSKMNVTVSQGGTGSSTAGASSGQALYNLGLVYSATEPASPTAGMVWLKPA